MSISNHMTPIGDLIQTREGALFQVSVIAGILRIMSKANFDQNDFPITQNDFPLISGWLGCRLDEAVFVLLQKAEVKS